MTKGEWKHIRIERSGRLPTEYQYSLTYRPGSIGDRGGGWVNFVRDFPLREMLTLCRNITSEPDHEYDAHPLRSLDLKRFVFLFMIMQKDNRENIESSYKEKDVYFTYSKWYPYPLALKGDL